MKHIFSCLCCIVFSLFILCGIFSMFPYYKNLIVPETPAPQKVSVIYSKGEILLYRPYDTTPAMCWDSARYFAPAEFDSSSDAVRAISDFVGH